MRPPRSRRDIGGPSMGRAVERVFAASRAIGETGMVAVANPGNGKSIADASPCARVDVDFSKALQECLDQVGPGRVATCGAIARALGDIRAARAVATWLVDHPDPPGAHRAGPADGRPVVPGATRLPEREKIPAAHRRVATGRFLSLRAP